MMHCAKSVRIWNYSGPHFPAFRLNTERYEVSPRTRITPNTDTFYTVMGTFVAVDVSLFFIPIWTKRVLI